MKSRFMTGLVFLAVASVLLLASCSASPSASLESELQSVISGLVKKDPAVKNCVLAVAKGDGSFSWSGAAGMAHGQTPMTKDTPIYIASVTKLYTATVVMRLCEEGRLSLDEPMAKYLPMQLISGIHVYRGKDYSEAITIAQLLSHSSGIGDYYSEKGLDGKDLFHVFMENPDRMWTVEETIERARTDLRPHFAPGAGTSYSDTNFQLLGKIIEAVSAKPLADAYQTYIFGPLALEHTWLIGHGEAGSLPMQSPADVFCKNADITRIRSNGAYAADGGIVSTADDMIRFLEALKEGRLVRPETLRQMHVWRRWHFPLDYGFGTMRFSLPRRVRVLAKMPPLWGHSGSTGSFLYYSEDLDLYVAGTIDQVDSPSKPFFALIYKALAAVVRHGGKS